jgi:hypothetical protein
MTKQLIFTSLEDVIQAYENDTISHKQLTEIMTKVRHPVIVWDLDAETTKKDILYGLRFYQNQLQQGAEAILFIPCLNLDVEDEQI